MKTTIHHIIAAAAVTAALAQCPACAKNATGTSTETATEHTAQVAAQFSADSAMSYVNKQCSFGPRVPNSTAHARCADWLEDELSRHGAQVVVQTANLKAFDGTTLHMRNIMGSFNPTSDNRTLLLAHYDTRPWADADPDPANHTKPVMGANDGASGVAVLLEIARQMALKAPSQGIDILFVDAEDYGQSDNDDSWALGAKYFAANPITPGYRPSRAILLDMVGGKDALFAREYFSQQAAGRLLADVWAAAETAGYSSRFTNTSGGAVTDDHLPLIQQGIPAIDIIEFCPQSGTGFNATWHTVSDTPENIDSATLKAVGQTLLQYIYQ